MAATTRNSHGKQSSSSSDETQSGSYWSKHESDVLVSAVRVKSSTLGKADQSSNYNWNAIFSYCRGHGVHKEIPQLRQQWQKLQEAYTKIQDWEQANEGQAYWSLETDRQLQIISKYIDREIYDALHSILESTGDPSTPVQIDPISSTSNSQTRGCTDGAPAPIPDSQPESSATSPADYTNTSSDVSKQRPRKDSIQKPPPIDGGPGPQPH